MNSTRFCDPSICETSSWVLGAAGECNNLTGICECPPGYSGVYILVSENDCHVSTLFKQILDTANFCVALSALVASIIALVKVTTEIFRIHRPSVVPIYGKIKMGYTGTDAKHKARHNHILQRKLLAVRNIVLFFIHSSCEVFRTSVLLRNHEAYAHGLPVDAAIISGIGLGASRCAFFLFLYIYTTSLPRNEQLSAVLGRRYDARKYKKMINWVFKFNGLLCMMIETAACWLNAVLPTWYRINFGVTQLIVHILIGASLHGLVCLVYYTNVPSFQKIIDFCSQHKSVPKLKTAIFRCKVLMTFAPPGIVFLAACAVLASFEPRMNFIPFTSVAMNESLLVTFGCYLLAWDFISIVEAEPEDKMNATMNSTQNKDELKTVQLSKQSNMEGDV